MGFEISSGKQGVNSAASPGLYSENLLYGIFHSKRAKPQNADPIIRANSLTDRLNNQRVHFPFKLFFHLICLLKKTLRGM